MPSSRPRLDPVPYLRAAPLALALAGILTSPVGAGVVPYDLVFVPPTPLPPNVAEGAVVTVGIQLTGGCDPFSPIAWNADAITGPGTATQGVDFSLASPSVVMFDGPNGRFATTTITIFDDLDVEGPETFDLKLTPNGPVDLTCGPSGPSMPEYILTLTIIDDDTGLPPTLEIDDVSVVEGDTGTVDAVFTVTLTNPPAMGTVTVDFHTKDGSASAGDGDYQTTNGLLTFGGMASRGLPTQIAQITVPVNGDTQFENDEFFSVELSNPDGAMIIDGSGDAKIFNDDLPTAQPAASIGDVVLAEGDTGNATAFFYIKLDQPSFGTVTMDYATRDGSATAVADYLATSGTVTFFPGDEKAEIEIIAFGDILPEPNELFFVDLSNPDGVTLNDAEGQCLILDDDPPPLPELTIQDITVIEGDTGATEAIFTVSISPPSSSAVSVSYATEDGTATGGSGPQDDYLPTSGRVTIAVGDVERTIRVPVHPDTTPEPDETFSLLLSDPGGATLARDQAVATIVNDDETAQPFVSIADTELAEGDEGTTDAILTLTLSEAIATPVQVEFRTADGTATTAANDYQATGGTAIFAAGATETTIAVPVVGDLEPEDTEHFFVLLEEAQGALLGDAKAAVTIIDDDVTLPSLSIDNTSVAEGDEGTVAALFTVTLSAPAATDVHVDVATHNGTATAGSDYGAFETELVIAAGDLEAQFGVPVFGDLEPEDDETFFANLSNPRNAVLDDGEGRAIIVDDDEVAALPVLAIRNAVVREGDTGRSAAIFRVRLTPPSATPVTVSFRTRDGTATAGMDYEPRTDLLRFAPGQTEAAFNIAVLGDTEVEDNELFRVELFAPAGATIGDRVATGGIINDDEALGTIRLVSAPPIVEQNGRARVTVRREGSVRLPARVVLHAVSGTAGTEDFAPLTRVLTWGAGEGGDRTIGIVIRDDQRPEPDETILVRLAEPRGAQLGSPSSLDLVIIDNDTAAQLEAVTDQLLTARARQELTLVVRAVDDDGAAVAGAMVRWQVAGEATLLGEEDQRTDAEGLSRQRLRLGRMPGEVTVAAELVGGDSAVAFVITVEGDLADLVDPDANPNDAGLAAVLDASCSEATGELADACAYIFGLEDDGERRQVLSALRPRNATATANRGLRAPEIQIRNLSARLRTLRGAANAVGRLSFDQISINLRGEGLTVGSLRQAATTPSAERVLAERIDAALATARGDTARGDQGTAPKDARGAAPARGGAASADDPEDRPFETGASRWGLFLTGRITIGDAPTTRREAGYDFETEGVTAGVDYRVGDRFVVGAALGYLRSETAVDNNLGRADVSGFSLSAYATYYRPRFYVDGMLSYGNNRYDLARTIVLPRPFQGSRQLRAVADPDGAQTAANLGFGYEMRLGAATALEGFARVGYTRAEVDAYRETGAGPFNLAFDDQRLESVLSEAGLELSRPFSLRWGVLQPSLRVAYLHEFADNTRLIRVRFGADGQARRFTLRTDAPDRDFFNLGAALTATLRHGWATFLQYDTDLARDDLNVYTVTGGVRKQLP